MLVRPHNGGIDDQVFEVRIFTQLRKKPLPNALLCPAPETSEHAIPVAELVGQVAPWRAGTNQPQYRVNEQTIVVAVPTLVALLAGNKWFNSLPLSVRQRPPNQDRPPVAILNHIRESEGIPLLMSTRPTAARRTPSSRRRLRALVQRGSGRRVHTAAYRGLCGSA